MVYYAGHGVFDDTTGKAYWTPVNATDDDFTNMIMAESITSNLKRMESKHILVVADSCYSGTMRDFSMKVGSNSLLQKMLKKKSRTLMASGGNEPVSDSGGDGHSIFAYMFIKGLNNMKQNVFTAKDLYNEHIEKQVAGNAKQTPKYKSLMDSGDEGGDFVFKRSE